MRQRKVLVNRHIVAIVAYWEISLLTRNGAMCWIPPAVYKEACAIQWDILKN